MASVENQWILAGPTASGKSALALAWARRLGAEVASVDAFQVYRGLDVGTGKATAQERAAVVHRLIDLVGITENFSVADYLKHAEVISQDKSTLRVWAGGTGLYVRALREGLSTAPASDASVLAELEALPTGTLVEELQRMDPAWCKTADLCNRRRLTRALAVYRQTGKTLSWWHTQQTAPLLSQAPCLVLLAPLDWLRERIAKRVHAMWAEGWMEEVEHLLKVNDWEQSQSAQAIGYNHIIRYIQGFCSKEECLQNIILETGQYAKRQLTWFRRERNVQFIDATLSESQLMNLALKLHV